MHHMKSYLGILAALALLAGAAPAVAQTYQYPYQPVQWFVNGGGSITQNDTAAFFDNG